MRIRRLGSNANEASVLYPLFPSPLIEFKHRKLSPADAADFIREEFREDAEKIFELYPGAKEGLPGALTDMLSDSMFGSKAFFYAVQTAKVGQPVYLYFSLRLHHRPGRQSVHFTRSMFPFYSQKTHLLFP